MVIVQSERGEDIGIIRDHDTSSSNMLRKPYHTKHILRIAHEDEQHEIHEKVREEEYILDTTRCYAKLFGFRYDNIIDVELQLDRYEITILYVSKEYINYKILIEKLNALYQTRIWFKQVMVEIYTLIFMCINNVNARTLPMPKYIDGYGQIDPLYEERYIECCYQLQYAAKH